MQKIFLGLLTAATLFQGAVHAAEPSPSAPDRATLYQREVRAVLSERGWRVTRDEAGKLTVEHRYIPNNGTNAFLLGDDNSYARLQIDFKADGKSHTAASARASLCIYEPLSSSHVGFMAYPLLALRDPKLTQDYLGILAEADARLAAGRHTDAANGTSSVQDVGSHIKVAIK